MLLHRMSHINYLAVPMHNSNRNNNTAMYITVIHKQHALNAYPMPQMHQKISLISNNSLLLNKAVFPLFK